MIRKNVLLILGLSLISGLHPSISSANDLVQLLKAGKSPQVIEIIQRDDFSTHYRDQVVSLAVEAAQSGHSEILQSLVLRGVRISHPRIKDSEGRSPLSLALKNHHMDAAQVLLASGVTIQPVIEAGNLELVRKMIDAGQLDPDQLLQRLPSGSTPFALAEALGHAELANFILALKFLKSMDDFPNRATYESLRFALAKRFLTPSEERARLILQLRTRLIKILQGEPWSGKNSTYDWVMPYLREEDTSAWISDEQLLQMDLRHAGFEIFYKVLYPRFFEDPELDLESLLQLKKDLRRGTLGNPEYQEIQERGPAQNLKRLFLARLALDGLPEGSVQTLSVLDTLKMAGRRLESVQAVSELLDQLKPWWQPLIDAKLIQDQKELDQAFMQVKKQQVVKTMARDFGFSSRESSLHPEVEGTCLVCLEESLVVSSPCSNHPAALFCHTCAERGLREVIREKNAQLRCLGCTSAHPMSLAYFERAGCDPELVDELRELEVRHELLKRDPHFQFCHRDGCIGGKVYQIGELRIFQCKICSFSGCLDCGKEDVSRGHYHLDGRCKGVRDSSELYTKLLRRGSEAPISMVQLQIWGNQGQEGRQASDFLRVYLKSLAQTQPKDGRCPICREGLGGVHEIEDHFYDGRYRPCPHCGMMIEKTPRAEGGACPNLTCGNPRCGQKFNFVQGLRGRTDAERRREYSLKRGLSPWFPGQEALEISDEESGTEGGGQSHRCSVM